MAATTPENWLDFMPAIDPRKPPEKGTPLIERGVRQCFSLGADPDDSTKWFVIQNNGAIARWNIADLRVRLDTSLGFGSALRDLRRRMGHEAWNQAGYAWMIEDWLNGVIGDDDRLRLAHSLAAAS